MERTRTLSERLLRKLAAAFFLRQRGEVDDERFGRSSRRSVTSLFKDLVWRLVYSREARYEKQRAEAALDRLGPLLPRLEQVHARLGDEHSRRILSSVVTYRLLGPDWSRAPVGGPAYWEQRQAARALRIGSSELPAGFMGWTLGQYDLDALGFPLRLYTRAPAVQHIFMMQQYRYARSRRIEVEAGDVVIDAGAGWGDSTLYFACRAGSAGRIFAFEFVPSNLRVLNENLALNPGISGSIQLVEHPLWSVSGLPMSFENRGPASGVAPARAGDGVTTHTALAIDDFAADIGLSSVDFIKMDIEGAEPKALQGACKVLSAHRPRLAISVYHEVEHLASIPEMLDSLDLGYRFYLDHFTTHAEETVLFAVCDDSPEAGRTTLG